MSDTYKGLTRAQWRYRILDFNGHLYDRSDLRGYTAKQLHDIQNGRLTIPTKKRSKTIQKNTAAVAAARSSAEIFDLRIQLALNSPTFSIFYAVVVCGYTGRQRS
jgi:hypothetical protein